MGYFNFFLNEYIRKKIHLIEPLNCPAIEPDEKPENQTKTGRIVQNQQLGRL